MADNVISAEKLQERLVANHFNAWMDLKILNLDEESIEISMSWREEMISNPKAGVTHGGILGALVDVAADFMIAAKAGAPAPTVDLRVDYHRAATPGDLRAVGQIVVKLHDRHFRPFEELAVLLGGPAHAFFRNLIARPIAQIDVDNEGGICL